MDNEFKPPMTQTEAMDHLRELAAEGPSAEPFPTALCERVTRKVEMNGIKWPCSGCGEELISWDPRLFEAVNSGTGIGAVVQCAKCKTTMNLAQKPKRLVLLPGESNRVAVPKMQLHRHRRS